MFFKFTAANAPAAGLPDARAADRLVSEFAKFPMRCELVWRIVDRKKCPNGLLCSTHVLRFALPMPGQDGTEHLLLPLLAALFGSAEEKASFGDPAFGTVAQHIFTTPFVMPNLAEDVQQDGSTGVSEPICRFPVHLALLCFAADRALVCSDAHVLAIVEHADADAPGGAAALNVYAAVAAGGDALSGTAVESWLSQRHENDMADFRAVSIVPVAAEVERSAQVYLPLADGSDQLLQWRVRAVVARSHEQCTFEPHLTPLGVWH
jgi:hypothetical protein